MDMDNPYALNPAPTQDEKIDRIMRIMLVENQEIVANSQSEIKMLEEKIANAQRVIKKLKTDLKHLNLMY